VLVVVAKMNQTGYLSAYHLVDPVPPRCALHEAVPLSSILISYEPITLLAPTAMSHSDPTASSSSNFQPIFNNALKAYERRTKKDLLAHPIATQLQACDSPSSILAVLQQQVEELENSDHQLTKWLDPTVNVLYSLSATLGEGVGLVRFRV
jgi:hypothetical protein